ncbi:MAG: DUF4249 family protein [Saprospiraceae bacterium]|nr:DUF4249 family protein [Saprospiraceae bacterium]
MSYKFFIALSGLFFFFSCSNDFDLTEGKTDIPVIYGLLSQNDTAVYVRVEKVFVDEEVEPKILASDPNNLYYDDITVELKNLRTNVSYIMRRVDGNLEGYPRSEGIFVQSPNILYKLHTDELQGGILGDTARYQITLKKEDGSVLASSTTRVLRKLVDSDIAAPSASGNLAFEYNRDLNISFRSDPFAFTHDLAIIIHYTEEKNGVATDKTLRWPIAKNFAANQPNNLNIQFAIRGRSFYEYLKSNLDADPLISRFLKSGSIEIISGGAEIKNYVSIVQANIGITSSGEFPTYTNIQNGVGLFSSRTRLLRENINFANPTRDSIANGIITRELNFR